jgi:hypothetical protein
MAQAHNDHHGKMGPLPTGEGPAPAGHEHHHGSAPTSVASASGMITLHSKAEVADVEGGARIAFIAMPAEIGALQTELRAHAQHLAAGTCAMAHAPAAPSAPAPVAEPVAPEPPAPAPVDPKAELLAAETAAYEKAKPVFAAHCARCHQQGGARAKKKTLAHFDMTSYPFGGDHAAEIGEEIREVLAIGGGKPSMPADKKGAVKGEELALIAAWADAFEAARAGGAHAGR